MMRQRSGSSISLLKVFCILIFAAPLSGQGQAKRAPVPVKISTRFQMVAQIGDADAIRLGSPVILTLRLANASSALVHLLETSDDFDYEVTISNQFGEEVPRTEMGRHLVEDERSSRAITREIKPGEALDVTLDLSTIFALRKTGKYYARVARVVVPATKIRGCEKVVSNAVSFNVVE